MSASRVVRVVVVSLALAFVAPSFTPPAPSGSPRQVSGVPVANANWTILETSGIQCTFALGSNPPTGDCTSNNVNVRVVRSAVSHSSSGELAVDLAVENLGVLRLATADGVTPDAAGVRVFVASGPFSTGGTGDVAIVNADGAGSVDTLGKPYFQYSGSLLGNDGILSPGETSGVKTWRLSVGPDVSQVDFSLGVAAEVSGAPTNTPTPTLASTETPVPSATPTNPPSSTPTDTPTSAPTASHTPTSSPTSISTPTPTHSPTSTPTQTVMPSVTATGTTVTTPSSTSQATRTPKPTKPPKSRD